MKARLEQALHAAWQKKGLLSALLLPFSWAYAGVIRNRSKGYERRPDKVHHDLLPIVVVGNLYVGGTGKTPVVVALVQALKKNGWRPGVISRGYGAKHGEAPRAGQGQLDPNLFGDEPALIAAQTDVPVCVHPDRPAALRRLRRQFPAVNVVVSDDGLQHLALGRDLEIVVQDARGIGNGRVLPAGPLRESPARLASVDFIINNLQAGQTTPPGLPEFVHTVDMTMQPEVVENLFTGETMPWDEWLTGARAKHSVAVAAIGRPERFFAMLRDHGLSLSDTLSLPDHYDYRQSPLTNLMAKSS